MQCPKCSGEMQTLCGSRAGEIRIDRCNECQGLYFDQLRRADLNFVARNVDIDSGSAELGAEYNEMVYVDCPKCHRMMDQRKVEAPHQIRFELCTSCYSTFLDAGELRQYLSLEYRARFEALLPA